jgi:hypothetical protein
LSYRFVVQRGASKNGEIFMSKISLLTLSLLCFATTIQASVLREAKINVVIEKKTYIPTDDGNPRYVTTPVCTKEAFINVYEGSSGSLEITASDMSLVQCDAKLFGDDISVALGGAITFSKNSTLKVSTLAKGLILILSWGKSQSETPQVTSSSWTESWGHFIAILAPVATGKIIDRVPQPPEPQEFFFATTTISDIL